MNSWLIGILRSPKYIFQIRYMQNWIQSGWLTFKVHNNLTTLKDTPFAMDIRQPPKNIKVGKYLWFRWVNRLRSLVEVIKGIKSTGYVSVDSSSWHTLRITC